MPEPIRPSEEAVQAMKDALERQGIVIDRITLAGAFAAALPIERARWFSEWAAGVQKHLDDPWIRLRKAEAERDRLSLVLGLSSKEI